MNRGVRLAINGAGIARHLDIDREAVIGRARDATVCLPLAYVSSQHLRIFPENGQWFVEELGSTNGTLCRGNALVPRTPVVIADALILSIDALELTLSPLESPLQLTQALSISFANEVVAGLSAASRVYLEALEGPHRGKRTPLDGTDPIGLNPGPLGLEITTPPAEISVVRDGASFFITDAHASRQRLANGSKINLFGTHYLFVDPLEAHLPTPVDHNLPDPSDPSSDARAQPDSPLTGQKGPPWLALVALGVVVAAALAILTVILI